MLGKNQSIITEYSTPTKIVYTNTICENIFSLLRCMKNVIDVENIIKIELNKLETIFYDDYTQIYSWEITKDNKTYCVSDTNIYKLVKKADNKLDELGFYY